MGKSLIRMPEQRFRGFRQRLQVAAPELRQSGHANIGLLVSGAVTEPPCGLPVRAAGWGRLNTLIPCQKHMPDNEIRSLFPSHPHSAYEQAFQGDESVRIDAMDVHVKAGRVYWTNWHTGTISFRSLPPAAPPTTSNRHRRQIDRGVTHLNVSTWHGVGSTHRHRLGRKSRRFRAELAEDSGRAESETGGLHHKAQTADRQ